MMATIKGKLIDKIKDKTACIAVVGLGRVGLPTAAMFARAGYKVIGADIKKNRVQIAASPTGGQIGEPGITEIIQESVRQKKLSATTDVTEAAKKTDVIIICVQTPVTRRKHTNLAYLERACEAIGRGLSRRKLVIVESTVPPGTSENLIARVLEQKSGLKCGKDFWLACCPETMAPGSFLREFVENPRIIGGHNEESAYIASELLKTVTDTEIATTDCTTAEVSKLVGNTFRDVNIAFANELALICEQIGVDVKEVIKLATMHPRARNIHQPGPGVGGPCLIKDSYLLLHSVKQSKFRSRVIKSSRELNNRMPLHITKLVVRALKEVGKVPERSKVAVLGVAYKGDIDDTTASPSRKIILEMKRLQSEITVFDPYSNETFGARKAETIEEAVRGTDCMIIATDHRVFREIKLNSVKALMGDRPVIVDGRRILNPEEAKKQGFRYFGTGYIDV